MPYRTTKFTPAESISTNRFLVPGVKPRHHLPVTEDNQSRAAALGRISVDWWATIVAGVFVVLAVFDVLPKIPW